MSRIRVLVIDDSAFARKVVRDVLSVSPEIEIVGIARDGLEGLEKIAELEPNVVTLDLVMPNLDGLGVLSAVATLRKRPKVIVVSMADEESELGVAALVAGAFDIVKKPTALALDRLYDLSDELRSKVLAAGRGSPQRTLASDRPLAAPVAPSRHSPASLLAIGASTGGPQALTRILRELPATFPIPLVLVLHMPEGYTEAFARRLDAESALDVLEAREGVALRAGQALVARAGMHLTLTRGAPAGGWSAHLNVTPLDTPHRPSIDVLFQSVAAVAGSGSLGVVLTGMGSDGVIGSRAIRAAGGRVLTESESSCVVYGMPRSVDEAGLSSGQAPIEKMVALITQNL